MHLGAPAPKKYTLSPIQGSFLCAMHTKTFVFGRICNSCFLDSFSVVIIKRSARRADLFHLVTASALAGLLYEGFTVNALTYGGICLVSGDANLIESAVILVATVVFTLLYGAFNRGIGRLVFHNKRPSFGKFLSRFMRLQYYYCPKEGTIIRNYFQFFS